MTEEEMDAQLADLRQDSGFNLYAAKMAERFGGSPDDYTPYLQAAGMEMGVVVGAAAINNVEGALRSGFGIVAILDAIRGTRDNLNTYAELAVHAGRKLGIGPEERKEAVGV